MATKTVLIDDLDGTSEAAESVVLMLNGVHVKLDLSEQHYRELNEFLAPYIHSGQQYDPAEAKAAQKRKLNHDERNSLLSYFRHHKGEEIKRVSAEHIAEWEQYIANHDRELLQKMDDRTTVHASEAAIEAALDAGEAIKENTQEPAPSPTTGRGRRTQKA